MKCLVFLSWTVHQKLSTPTNLVDNLTSSGIVGILGASKATKDHSMGPLRLLATLATPWKRKKTTKHKEHNIEEKQSEASSQLRVVVSTSSSDNSTSLKDVESTEEIEVAIKPKAQFRGQPEAKRPNTKKKNTFAEVEKKEETSLPSELGTGILLRTLRESTTLQEATNTIKTLYALLGGLEVTTSVRAASAEIIARFNGAGTIILALQKWFPFRGEDFTVYAIRSLIQICRYYPRAKQNIVNIGGVGTVLAAARFNPGDPLVNANAVGLFCNLSSSRTTKQDVASEKCIDFIIRTMKNYPNHRFIQRNGCAYLSCIGEIEGMTDMFRRKDIDILLLQTFNNYRERQSQLSEVFFVNKCKEIQAFAKLGMVVYMSGVQRPVK
eukprot:scaffold672_cov126-Cylindrotheca_fusiformis.AAC.38